MKKILIFLASFIIGIFNIPAAQPTVITTPNLAIGGELRLGGDSLGAFGRIPAGKLMYSAGPNLKELPGLITSAYTFSNELKNKINDLIRDLYGTNGRIATLQNTDVAIQNRLNTAINNINTINTTINTHVNNLNTAIRSNTSDIRNLDGRVDTLESNLLVIAYNTSHSSMNVATTTGYIAIPFSYILDRPDKVISGYIDKKTKPDIKGYYLQLDASYDDPRIIPGKVYRLILSGNTEFDLLVRNLSTAESYPRVFVCGGTVTSDNFKPWTNKTTNKTYSQYSSLGAYRNYLIEIHVAGNGLYLTINQSNWRFATPTDRVVNQQITSDYTCTYMNNKTTSTDFTPRVDGTGSGNYTWVVNAGGGDYNPTVALTVKLLKTKHIQYDQLKATMTFRTFAGSDYAIGPRIYVYNSNGTPAQIEGDSCIQMANSDKKDQRTQTETITFNYSGADDTYYLYKVLIDAMAYGVNHSFSMRIDTLPENITFIGNPQ